MVSWTGSDFLIFTEDSRLVIREPKQSPKGVSWKRSACWVPMSTFRQGLGQAESPAEVLLPQNASFIRNTCWVLGPELGSTQGELVVQTGDRLRVGK